MVFEPGKEETGVVAVITLHVDPDTYSFFMSHFFIVIIHARGAVA